MKESETMSLDELKDISTKYDSMYFHNNSNKAARNLFLYILTQFFNPNYL